MADVDFTQDVSVTNGSFGESGGMDAASRSNDDRKLFIGGLSFETREPQLKEYFEKYGEVELVNLKINPMTGKSRCFAFVVFKDAASVPKVFEAGEHAINSKRVDVKKSKPKPGKIFVGGLKTEMTDDDIRQAFGKFGTIIDFEMPMDKVKKVRKGFGFITFEREETMKELIKRGKVQVGEHMVDLRKATPKPDQNAGGFWNGGRGGGQAGGGGYGGGYGGGAGGYGDYGGGYGGGAGGMDYGGYGQGGGFGGDYYGSQGSWGYGGGGGYGGGYGATRGGGKMRGGQAAGATGMKRGGAPY